MVFLSQNPVQVLAGLAWYWLVRNTPQEHPWMAKKELDTIQAGLPARPKGAGAEKTLPWQTILGNRSMAAVTFSYFVFGYVAWSLHLVLHIPEQGPGLHLKSSAFFSMVPFIAMAVCSTGGGWLADVLSKRYGKRVGRCGVALVGIALAGVFIALATQVESAQLASIVLAGGAGALDVPRAPSGR